MELHETISNWLAEDKLMQLSTSVNDQPWVCTVGYVSDEDFNIYWFSSNDKRHSIEVTQNSNVAATIVHDTKTRQALQLTGTARRLPMEDAARVHSLYVNKLGFTPISLEDLETSEEVSFWHLKPTMIATWDALNFPDNPKQEYFLDS